MGAFKKINFGLKKTRDNMSGAIDNVLNAFEEIGDELYDELTEALVMADVGVYTAEEIITRLKERVKEDNIKNPEEVKNAIKEIITEMLSGDEEIDFVTVPAVILVIGVNGVGKTTTIGKMAAYFKARGKKVILGAADTFRAAAIDQLEIWADRAGVELVKHKEGADPAAVVFDTISAGIARDADVIIIDTAGRLHNKKNLMDELAKIYRVIDRELPYSDRESFLVLDATTGQNAVNQAKEFKAVADITGIILTKLDGTARGGVVLSIKNDLKVPVKFIGVGEKIDDLQPFSAKAFAEGLFDVVSDDFEEEELKIEDNAEKENLSQQITEDTAENIEQVEKTEKTKEENKEPEKEVRKEQQKAEKKEVKKTKAKAENKEIKVEEKVEEKIEEIAKDASLEQIIEDAAENIDEVVEKTEKTKEELKEENKEPEKEVRKEQQKAEKKEIKEEAKAEDIKEKEDKQEVQEEEKAEESEESKDENEPDKKKRRSFIEWLRADD